MSRRICDVARICGTEANRLCDLRQDIPDDELLAAIFSEASRDSRPCSPPPWAVSGQVEVPSVPLGSSKRALSVHLSTQLMSEGKTKELIFLSGKAGLAPWCRYDRTPADEPPRRLTGATLDETSRLAFGYRNVVPVGSSGDRMTLLDLSAPFLFRGRRRHYGSELGSMFFLRQC